MTDLEICKRIAEIEGYRVSTDVKPSCGSVYANIYPDNCYGNYNPLTDDALCFKLMVKHNIKLSRNRSEEFVAIQRGSAAVVVS